MSDQEKPCVYDSDYFLRGKQTGKSCYENYRWLPDLTIPMVGAIVSYLGVEPSASVLDFGCARGYTVRAFCEMGYNAFGIDASEWAVTNCDPLVRDYLYHRNGMYINHINGRFDWILAKDVLEHVPDAVGVVNNLLEHARVGVFAVVPLAEVDNEKYTIRCYEKDITHIHRLTLATWVSYFLQPGWEVTASYRVKGVKDNYSGFATGNGFITCRRIEV